MADYLATYTDQQVDEFAKKIAKIYAQAAKEIQEKYDDYAAKYAVKDQKKFADFLAGKITLEKYQNWLKGQVFIGKQWEQKVKDITNIYLNADKKAHELLSDTDENVFTEAANHSAYEIEQNVNGAVSFDMFDKETVKRLIKDNPKMLPEWKIDEKKDYIWNEERVQNVVTQAIIQGEKIPDIAKRLGKELATSNAKKMVLFARTATNGAQNAGRIQRMHETADMGLDVRKEWIAASDSRVRDTHRELNGQICKEGEKFKVGTQEIEYPGDPTAAPALVYNCRCSIGFVYPKYNKAEKGLYYIGEDGQKHEVTDMTYKEWTAAKEKEKADKEAAEQAAKKVQQVPNQATQSNLILGYDPDILKQKAANFDLYKIIDDLYSQEEWAYGTQLNELGMDYVVKGYSFDSLLKKYVDGTLEEKFKKELDLYIAKSILKTENPKAHVESEIAVQNKQMTEFKKEIDSVNHKLSVEFGNALKEIAQNSGFSTKEIFSKYQDQKLSKSDTEKLDKIVGEYLEKKAAGEVHVKKKYNKKGSQTEQEPQIVQQNQTVSVPQTSVPGQMADYSDWIDRCKRNPGVYDLRDGEEEETFRRFTREEADALKEYTGSYYTEINDYLRRKAVGAITPEEENRRSIKEAKELSKKCHSALKKASLPEDRIFRRGTDVGDIAGLFMNGDFSKNKMSLEGKNAKELNTMFKGAVGSYAGLTSTSSQYDRGFYGHVEVVLNAPKGTHCASIMRISQFGVGEGETLFIDGTRVICEGFEDIEEGDHLRERGGVRMYLTILVDEDD